MPSFFLESLSGTTSTVIKARGGLLDINAKAFKKSTVGLCTLCNLDAAENTVHLIGICPIYNAYRLQYFGKLVLDTNEVIAILNGNVLNFKMLQTYINACVKYRKLILNEFY